MSGLNNLILLFILLVSYNVVPSIGKSTVHTDVSPLVQQICESTDHPSLCLSIIIPRISGNSDLATVLEIAVRTTADLAKTGLNKAKNLTSDPTTCPDLKSVLKDCEGFYETAVSDFDKTLAAFPTRDIGSMRTRLSAVMTVVEDCQDGLHGYDNKSPFTDIAHRLTNMTSNCLAIIALLNE